MTVSSSMDIAKGPAALTPVPRRSRRHLADLVLHLVRRELASAHRNTLLGWAWPLTRQLAQLAVLVFLFSHVLRLHIQDYPVFVFAGLIVFTWFQAALIASAYSVVSNAHFVTNPKFPTIALPLVAVAVPFFDVLMALPVLLVLLAVAGRLGDTALLLPPLIAVQFAFTAGVALLTSAANVYLRDVQNVVVVLLLLLFYMTPIFYGLKNVPPQFHWVLRANPLTAFVNADRAVLFEGHLPAAVDLAILTGSTIVALAIGLAVFRRLQPGFVDEL
ncbi:MAG TPA: ABC transporter permease [Solirubrobacteraceae bacterium]|jgi:ABC-type polysaccharide/polyol phosphate export permease